MFVPVGCTHCGKPFQVPEAALGKSAVCPWCQSVVAALPVAAVVEPPPPAPATEAPPAPKWLQKYTTDRPRALPITAPTGEEPLSLDDEPPPAPQPQEAKGRSGFRPVAILVGAAVSLAVTALTVAALGYRSGRVQESFWTEYTAPDGSCAVLLPAPPAEEDVSPNPVGSVTGGKRYVATGWYTRSAAWLAWNDLDPAFAAVAARDKDKAFTASVIQAELGREKARLQGTVTKEAEVRFNFAWGVEVHLDTAHGKVIEWLLVAADGPRPRLYVYGVRATNIAHDSAVVRRMFTSFKIKE